MAAGLCILHSCCYQVPVIIRDAKTWKEAQSYCRENHNDLITINSKEEATVLGDILRNSAEEFWIGLYSNFYNFRWSMVQEGLDDEGQLEYSNWQPTQPNGDTENIMCGNMVPSGQWADFLCSLPSPFVCYDGKRTYNHKTSLSSHRK
uniref:C-type lectin domain-containing protein n=1 Tax=Salarias fasciatus TaxID=181472 RepID=A0A672GV19_SALFA